MPALGIVGLVLVALLVVVTLGSRAGAAEPALEVKPATEQKAAPLQTSGLTREQIAEKLRALARTEVTQKFTPGAECYKPSMPPTSAEYLCPRCGSRTHYSNNVSLAAVIRSLPNLRDAVKRVHGVDATLDESAFCQKCRGAQTESPAVVLIVRYPDGSSQRTSRVSYEDVLMLSELLEGKDVHAGAQDEQSPLKDHLPRLRALLGVPEK